MLYYVINCGSLKTWFIGIFVNINLNLQNLKRSTLKKIP